MPMHEPDPTDPMQLMGVALPDGGEETLFEMAACFVEEFMRLGHTPEMLLSMFQNPRFRAPHRAWNVFGPARIAELIDTYAPIYARGGDHADRP